MNDKEPKIRTQHWTIDQLSINHHLIDYPSLRQHQANDDAELVRLHFGLQGHYRFHYQQLDCSFALVGHHNNLMYSQGMNLAVENQSLLLETFGIHFQPDFFIHIAQNGNDPLKRFVEKVDKKEAALFSPYWRPNPFALQQVIQEMIHCPFVLPLKNLFLLSKSIELLVLQAQLYEATPPKPILKSSADRKKLLEARALLLQNIEDPPTLHELAKRIQLNEYQLKKGFKALFGLSVFG
ncbi:MAG: hypothetical protein AAGD05_16060, partial [Bacteroidota bacterium]